MDKQHKKTFRYCGHDVTWTGEAYSATADEGQTSLLCPSLARLIHTIVEAETYCRDHQDLPDWLPTPDNPVLEIPREGKIALPVALEYSSLVHEPYRLIRVDDMIEREVMSPLVAFIGPDVVQVLHGLNDARLWGTLAVEQGAAYANANYRHYLNGKAEIWVWTDYEPPRKKPDQNDPIWSFYERLDPVYGSRDPKTFVEEFRFHDYTISLEEDLFIAVPDDGMKFEFSSSNLGGVLFAVLEMLTPRARTGRSPLWLPNKGEDNERVPDERIRVPDDAVPFYEICPEESDVDGIFRSPSGPHCTMPIWWVDTGKEVRAFTRPYHAIDWERQAMFEGAQEADLSYRLAIKMGTDNYPAGF